jgi:hypothetical protein
MQWFIFYFARRELNISHALSRQFWWYRNVLLPHELPARTTVLLSGRDEISPSHNHMVEKLQQSVQLHNHNNTVGTSSTSATNTDDDGDTLDTTSSTSSSSSSNTISTQQQHDVDGVTSIDATDITTAIKGAAAGSKVNILWYTCDVAASVIAH